MLSNSAAARLTHARQTRRHPTFPFPSSLMSGVNDAPPAQRSMCTGIGMPALRIMGFLSGATVITLGVYSIIQDGAGIGNIVNNLYRIIFGILIILAELRLTSLLKWFSFLTFFAGLGAFYVFVGGIACGSNWYEIALAVLLCVIGFIYSPWNKQ